MSLSVPLWVNGVKAVVDSNVPNVIPRERAVDVQIVNLRRKLSDFGNCIETVRGMGYKLKEATK